MSSRRENVLDAYDRVTEPYAKELENELAHKPLDRALLSALAEQLRDRGPVADMGCGPGHVAAHLHALGLPVIGVDVSEKMIAHAKTAYPQVRFVRDDMLRLQLESQSLGGVVAFYSIVHFELDEVAAALGELHRVLRPGGVLLLSFHEGTERIALREWMGHPVELEWILFSTDDIERRLMDAGFAIDARIVRAPYVPFEHPTQRAYLLAHRPG